MEHETRHATAVLLPVRLKELSFTTSYVVAPPQPHTSIRVDVLLRDYLTSYHIEPLPEYTTLKQSLPYAWHVD